MYSLYYIFNKQTSHIVINYLFSRFFVFILGDFESAQMTLQHCLEQDQALSDAHILMAQVNANTSLIISGS